MTYYEDIIKSIHKDKTKKLGELVDIFLVPQELEKKVNAEVSTPYQLRQEMLDKIPVEFWTSPKKVLEPCSGKGGFVVDIVHRFMEGLKNTVPDEKERYRTIVEECIYFCDINSVNIFICKLLLDPYGEYKLQYNEGDTLKYEPPCLFDAVIGNPPYQNNTNNKGTGNTLWNKFVDRSLTDWLVQNGYLLFVHPRGWRQVDNKTGSLMLSKQIHYLNMNDVRAGIKMFGCSTDYDYYLIENCDSYTDTTINDYDNGEYQYPINSNLRFIPNHSLNEVYDLIEHVEDNGFMNSKSDYETRQVWISKVYDDIHTYPCIYSINSKGIISNRWSSRNDRGHFGIPKFIFSNGNGYYKDISGKYGLTEWAYAIKCDEADMDTIERVFNSDNFNNIVNAISLTSNKYNYRIMKLFKKDFWKEFI